MNHHRYLFIPATIVLVSFLTSCAPSVNFTSMGVKREPKSSGAQIYVFTENDSLPRGAVILGKISVKDAGLTIHCDYDVVLAAAQDKARQAGADAIKIISVSTPDLMSSCYGIDALAVSLDKADTSHLTQKLNSPSYADFLSFSDASPCQDYGDTNFLASRNLHVLSMPFMVRTNIDGKVRVGNYALTQPTIDRCIQSGLASRFTVLDPSVIPASHATDLNNFLNDMADKAAAGKTSPVEWGDNLQFGIIDSSATIYLPLGIERESQHHTQGRFYAVVLNSTGKVLYAKCMGYNPNRWSSETDAFVRDTKGKLLLLEN